MQADVLLLVYIFKQVTVIGVYITMFIKYVTVFPLTTTP